MYYIYMLRCEDNSIYTGITTNIERRMKEHFEKNKKCAKYTFRHSAKKLECVWQAENRALASKLEYAIKKLTKQEKEKLIVGHDLGVIASIEKEKYIIYKDTQKKRGNIHGKEKDEIMEKNFNCSLNSVCNIDS